MKQFWMGLLIVCAMGMLAAAQEQAMDPEQQKAMAAYAAAGAVNENHEFLKKLAGNWEVQLTSWMAPGKPPMASKAMAKGEMRLGDRFLFLSFTGDMFGMAFEGLQVIGYDNMKKMYVTYWVDNTSTHVFVTKGTREGNVITETGTWPDPLTGDKKQVKARTTLVNDDEYLYEQFMVMADGKEFKSLENRCRRQK